MDDQLPTIDPVAFVARALADLPDDPAAATADDLETLSAIAEGCGRYATDVLRSMRCVTHLAVDGEVTPAALAEFAWLQALTRRCELAQDLFNPYVLAAAEANGFSFTTAGDHKETTR